MQNTPYTILVVDDEVDLFDLFRQKFKNEIKAGQLIFDFAENGEEALKKLTGPKKFHLLFTDIRMPVMDGLTLLNHVKELKLEMKTVVISAYDDLPNIRIAMNREAFDFLVKPILFDDLKLTLEKAIREYENYISGIEAKKKLIVAVKEKEAAVLKERLRISRDLHDDIGATLSAVSICAETALHYISENKEKEAELLIARIAEDARDTVLKISETVWVLKPENDTIEKLFDRIRTYAFNVLSVKNILFNFNSYAEFYSFPLEMEERKNIYMILKESINNAAKYAACSEVNLTVQNSNDFLIFMLKDNGTGFDESVKSNGNGIKNMYQRSHEINSLLSIQSAKDNGTIISLSIPKHKR